MFQIQFFLLKRNDYMPLDYKDVFTMATLGGAKGKVRALLHIY